MSDIRKIKMVYRTVKIGDLDFFCREAGPKDGTAVLLLHGFPTSSHMFPNLIPTLADLGAIRLPTPSPAPTPG
jgi:pimeloyl-ACP methyl ester carboxylesterase